MMLVRDRFSSTSSHRYAVLWPVGLIGLADQYDEQLAYRVDQAIIDQHDL